MPFRPCCWRVGRLLAPDLCCSCVGVTGPSLQHTDRRQRKRQFRRLWIVRINAAARLNGVSYSKLMGKDRQKGG